MPVRRFPAGPLFASSLMQYRIDGGKYDIRPQFEDRAVSPDGGIRSFSSYCEEEKSDLVIFSQ
ncbi:hypothetical protein ebA2017 [Aromatoleum aromaticum EbN1]|uniref:Uncharacterized protein n=1 Tax=Aromatoleum aromaticum (strain DSM 19018 / LMG 30748 / EbN1) TaxID=76114 RepID=Q5P618_AROAE|nr:hypothetical protein ebA2017 [Aromatoleum aromaticum EbN1]